jgi:hypothetical protein
MMKRDPGRAAGGTEQRIDTDGNILGLSPGNSDNPDDWSHS